ncbi:4-(cytidine 5'-diphospho)-2-C-methyl-D-erythritol kinase [Pseudoflavonifractor sp. MSJ-37]|uniref:4-(cytidine 5'-diphospho)-2-C-methyl-D-erythritol kinase n=1 Tax=Pseudoflavonifractor sp. MSJ-37 TaxID=2841531 RepID=UPI001C10160C|nr:4-(cytidine 5'-diphospho)-2-C-methyl-D-erythritol kinase [Pseudoflavonifractor sp. MSJ-37]MBU5435751.1 4-(cytidine 5'-diphospho)-2-C-methyl-D-erythritol kinase [Pseudoflavonifractor sp. MSJ-37]
MTPIVTEARAKLNLTLDVLGRREDGYHDLCMVMQSVALCDTVTIEREEGGKGIKVRSDLDFLPSGRNNLAAAAAIRLCDEAWRDSDGLRIRLDKAIPVCAGMGGGSSDAAAVLRALNEAWKLGYPRERLAEIGADVGSDVPYCVLGGTALAEGRGERLTPLPALPWCFVVICKPHFSISTPELFERIDGMKISCHPDTKGMLKALERGDVLGVARRMYNVFEDVLPRNQGSTVAEIKDILLQHGALGACMSGTGPTVFGLYDDIVKAWRACHALRKSYEQTFLTVTV